MEFLGNWLTTENKKSEKQKTFQSARVVVGAVATAVVTTIFPKN
jgi:hypothetical protein